LEKKIKEEEELLKDDKKIKKEAENELEKEK
jgi:hypothetical protein